MPKKTLNSKESKNTKSYFWQALVLTVIVFIIGIFLGIAYEGNRLEQINEYYVLSEISLMDALALSRLTDIDLNSGIMNCEVLIQANTNFADRIYSEALLLEKYEESGKLTEALRLAHTKYDLLRTILWLNVINIPEQCKRNVSIVVYLYEYDSEDLTKKAINRVWSRILYDLKRDVGNKIILIPIAVDSDLTSLDSLISRFNISSYPALIIDNEKVFLEIKSADELKKHLK
ncbi:hypothetical protein FJZ20_00895 [Candidatus Pacearchaeota archaeon]|nr:hypothetical protein [Candidatus Pacearchaeota archaeon]